MELSDTIDGMISEDYKERFKAEYYQLKIRHDGLEKMMKNWRENKLDFEPTCSYTIYVGQLDYMKKYMGILETRAKIENIEL